MTRLSALVLAALAVLVSAAPAAADEPAAQPPPSDASATETATTETGAAAIDGWVVGVELHTSLLSGVAGRSLLNPTFGWAVRVGHRWDGWGILALVEQNLWRETELDDDIVAGVLNLGLGGEFFFADGFVFTRAVGGPSILLFDTILDDAGSVGFYADIRPLGLRFTPIDGDDTFGILLEPLTLTLVAPVLESIPLVQVEYRTVGSVEVQF